MATVAQIHEKTEDLATLITDLCNCDLFAISRWPQLFLSHRVRDVHSGLHKNIDDPYEKIK